MRSVENICTGQGVLQHPPGVATAADTTPCKTDKYSKSIPGSVDDKEPEKDKSSDDS